MVLNSSWPDRRQSRSLHSPASATFVAFALALLKAFATGNVGFFGVDGR
jgi:hypothetical protein